MVSLGRSAHVASGDPVSEFLYDLARSSCPANRAPLQGQLTIGASANVFASGYNLGAGGHFNIGYRNNSAESALVRVSVSCITVS